MVIICAEARANGAQYTKRLLPDFLAPYSPIRLDRVLEAERKRREEGVSLEECCLILGCIELRTVRTHLNRLPQASDRAALQISLELAQAPQYASLPIPDPDRCAIQRLQELHRIASQAAAAAGLPEIPFRHMLQASWRHPAGKKSTSCVSRIVRPP